MRRSMTFNDDANNVCWSHFVLGDEIFLFFVGDSFLFFLFGDVEAGLTVEGAIEIGLGFSSSPEISHEFFHVVDFDGWALLFL